ncbi:helix-turn-helix domain-containing protein [Pseudomonas sp. Z5-35]|uniref:helix-turn-helix domain-containing protein n=1 Tax=unclassified Pseudomonas TaxID=196821 RepID=UPI003DA8F261
MSDSIGQKTSLTRHHEPAGFRLLAKRHERGAVLPSHEHQTGQLVFALSGIMLIETHLSRWTIPPQRALWIPPHQPHTIQILSDVEMRTVYFQPALFTQIANFARCHEVHAVVASTLIKELVLGLFEQPREDEMRDLMVHLLLHALREAACLPTHLPMPTDDRLRTALMELISGNQWHWPISEIAYRAAMSERTFTRRFSAEVGLNYRTWHQRARIVASLDLLASNRSVKSVAHTLQFASAAAYVAAFRKITGSTPRAFQATHLMQSMTL